MSTPIQNKQNHTSKQDDTQTQAKPITEKVREEKLDKIHHHSEEKEASEKAKEYNLPYIDLNIVPIDADTLDLLPKVKATWANVAIIHRNGKNIQLAITDPNSDRAKEVIEKLQETFEDVTAIMVSQTSMKRALSRYKKTTGRRKEAQPSLTEEQLKSIEGQIQSLEDLKTKITSVPASEGLNTLLGGAIAMKASDIHIEPKETEAKIRYRIDGVLQDTAIIPLNYLKILNSRIKVLSELKLNIRDEAQDGRFTVKLASGDVDMRVSLIPGNYGESIVMRLLNQSAIDLKVEALGLEGRANEILQREIKKPNGMILTTGPTGSGKTTTLYALLNHVNNTETKIITLEDPVEYRLDGIQQTQVEEHYTFTDGLRAVLRQDPDVLMVGEIRDLETAEIATHAALTGHVVFSTLHTNDAAGAVPRLLDMGIQGSFLKPAINAIIGQRLVRKLCEHCKESYEPAEETLTNITKVLSVISPKANIEIPKNITTLSRANGCKACNNTGYKGRIGLFEVFTISVNIEELINNHATSSEIMAAAIEDGMVTMLQDGILKAARSITSMEEVYRVLGEGQAVTEIYDNIISQQLDRGIVLKNNSSTTEGEKEENTLTNLQQQIDSGEQTQLTNLIIKTALTTNAGDIHLEPEKDKITIRFRIDGSLQAVGTIPKEEYPQLIGSIKLLAGFPMNSTEVVQDGRFSITQEDQEIDARLSVIKGGYGETAVIRILKQQAIALSLSELGFRQSVLQSVEKQLHEPNGMILTTGPTGSGKTTTLYAFLTQLNTEENKIITIEDPVEYRLDGILQTQINEEENYTFVTALRALLRQNPNIIMVGEIRDQETGETATEAALTGHLLLSTLHTNNASETFQRLSNMGTSAQDIATATNMVIAQRLVRKLCKHCKEEVSLTETQQAQLESALKDHPEYKQHQTIHKAKGCEKCSNIGFKGIVGIYEVLIINNELQDKISMQVSPHEIEKLAKENGMTTLLQDGLLKVLEGTTTFEEVQRVTKA